MRAKHNWEALKQDYIKKTYKTLGELATAHNIPYGQVCNKVKEYADIVIKVEDKMIDKLADRKARALESRAELGKRYLEKAKETLDDVEVKSAVDNSRLAEIGMKLENSGLGIKEDDDKSSTIQIALVCPIQFGSEMIGGITTKEVLNIKEVKDDNPSITISK